MKKIKYIFILCSVLLITNCQPELDTIPTPLENIRRVVNAEDIPKVTNALLGKLGLSNGTQRLVMNENNELSGFEIDWDRILQSIDSVGGETYTFNVDHSEENISTFYNLVIKFTPEGSPYKPFIMKYDLDSTFVPAFLSTGSLENFVGVVTKIPLSASNTSNGDYGLNSGPENVRMVTSDPDCPPQNIIDNGDGNNNGGGGPGSLPGPGTGGTVTYVTVQRCDYYLVKNPYNTLVNGEYSSTDFYYTMEENCYEYSYYSHTESPDGSNCETGPGEIPIITPPLELRESIDYSALRECYRRIIDKLINHSFAENRLDNMLQTFAGYNPTFGLRFLEGSLPEGTTARTSSQLNADGSVNITIDPQKFVNATDLAIARTVYHEVIHAYIVSIALGNPHLTAEAREQLLGPDWVIMFDNNGHDYMIQNMVMPMADLLEIYAQNNGVTSPYETFFMDLAYGGLTHNRDGTQRLMFQNMVPSRSDRDRIIDTITIETRGKDFNGNPKSQKGNDPGC